MLPVHLMPELALDVLQCICHTLCGHALVAGCLQLNHVVLGEENTSTTLYRCLWLINRHQSSMPTIHLTGITSQGSLTAIVQTIPVFQSAGINVICTASA